MNYLCVRVIIQFMQNAVVIHCSAGKHARPVWNDRWKLSGAASGHQQDQGQDKDWSLPRHLSCVRRWSVYFILHPLFFRDVKSCRPPWPRGQILWPRPHRFWPQPRLLEGVASFSCIWPRPRGLNKFL